MSAERHVVPERDFHSFVNTVLIPIATAAAAVALSTARCLPAWQTTALHAHVRRKYGGKASVRSLAFYMDVTDTTLRVHSTQPGAAANIGISWSYARQMYVGGVKTKDGKAAFPTCKEALPLFLTLFHALCVPEVFVFDQASVKCPCGADVQFFSLVRMLAGKGTLYELFPGRFTNPKGVSDVKRALQDDDTPQDDRDVCARFTNASASRTCVHVKVDAAVGRALQRLSVPEWRTPGGTFVFQQYTLVTGAADGSAPDKR